MTKRNKKPREATGLESWDGIISLLLLLLDHLPEIWPDELPWEDPKTWQEIASRAEMRDRQAIDAWIRQAILEYDPGPMPALQFFLVRNRIAFALGWIAMLEERGRSPRPMDTVGTGTVHMLVDLWHEHGAEWHFDWCGEDHDFSSVP